MRIPCFSAVNFERISTHSRASAGPEKARHGEGGGRRQRADADARIDQGRSMQRSADVRKKRHGSETGADLGVFFRFENGQVENISPLLQEPNLRQFFGLVGTVRRLQWMTR